MVRGDACASLDLLTRLSPEDVDEGRDGVGVFGGERMATFKGVSVAGPY